MKDDTSTRLKQIMAERNLKQVDIINLSLPFQKKLDINMSKSHLSQYVNGKSSPDQHKLYLLAQTLGVSEAWLLGYDVPKKQQTNIPDNLKQVIESIKIPVLGIITCGDPILAEQNIVDYREEIAENVPSGELFYLQTKGNSMTPTIPENAYVLIRKQESVENNEIAAVLVNGDTEATLKRVRYQGDTIILMPDNSEHNPIIANEENPVRIIGKAIKVSIDL